MSILKRLQFRSRLILLGITMLSAIALGETAPTTGPTTTATTAPTTYPSTTAPAPLNTTPAALADLVASAESTSSNLREIAAGASNDQLVASVESELPGFAAESDARLEQNAKILAAAPSLDVLRQQEQAWDETRRQLKDWRGTLDRRATQLDRDVARLAELTGQWRKRGEDARNAPAPAEALVKVESLLKQIDRVRTQAESERARVFLLQTKVSELDARVVDAIQAVKAANDEAVGRLLTRDSPPLWSPRVRDTTADASMVQQGQNSLKSQVSALASYISRKPERFVAHGTCLLALAFLFYWMRGKAREWEEKEPAIKEVAIVFNTPLETAAVLSVIGANWIYPQAPRLLWAILGAVALFPAVIILRRLLARSLHPILYALVAFYLADQVRNVIAVEPVLVRLLFLAEMLGGTIFLISLLRGKRLATALEGSHPNWIWVALIGFRAGLFLMAMAFIAGTLGYMSLATLLGGGVIVCAEVAVIFFAAATIIDGFILIALRTHPLDYLSMVKRHQDLLQHRGIILTRWLIVLLWTYIALQVFNIYNPVTNTIRAVLTAEASVGAFHLSLGNVLAFCLVIWLSILLSRLIRFVLQEDIYARMQLPRGLPYAISNMVHYTVLLIGFFAAVNALGYDLTKFTILAGAFGVGLGFGLQNIFNNFVSGLILLVERPVQVGDVVQLGDMTGSVGRIGIRATIIVVGNGSEVIVPNGQLISGSVTNWTLSDRRRSVVVPLSIDPAADPKLVMETLTTAATANPMVAKYPPPRAIITALGAAAINYELQAWVNQYEQWSQVRSELSAEVKEALAEAKIAMK